MQSQEEREQEEFLFLNHEEVVTSRKAHSRIGYWHILMGKCALLQPMVSHIFFH